MRRYLRQRLRYHAPDAVHLHNFKEAGTAAIAACRDCRIPVVWTCLDYWCLSPHDVDTSFSWRSYRPVKRHVPWIANLALIGRQRRIMRWLNRLDAVICLSEHSKQLLRDCGLTVPPIHVVPLPVTVPRIDHVPNRNWLLDQQDIGPVLRDPNLVLFVGGPAPHKGKHIFDAAMKIVQQELPWIVGKSMTGATRDQVLREIARAACLVVPEQWPNPGPVVIVEAQLLGTPVVASRVGGIPEMGPTLVCDPAAADFAEKITQVLSMNSSPLFMAYPSPLLESGPAKARHDPASVRAQLAEVYRSCGRS